MYYILFDSQNKLYTRFDSEIHKNVPSNAVEVDYDTFNKTIQNPELIWSIDPITQEITGVRTEFVEPLDEFVEQNRLRAYADPVNGSDRFLMHLLSLKVEASDNQEYEAIISTLKDNLIKRKSEIKKMYPYSSNKTDKKGQ